jgi:prepilin-type N-terminal cleavage/methylation domain-containing protein
MRRNRNQQDGVTLVELLVVLVIMGVVTTMIIGTWVALQQSYAFTTDSTRQRVDTRETMARVIREVRDAQGGADASAIISAGRDSIEYMTSFNDPGTDNSGVNRLTRLTYDPVAGTITRTRDTSNDGALGAGDASRVLLQNVVNDTAPGYGQPAVFSYDYYDANGELQKDVESVADPSSIVSVHVRLLVDLQPGQAPRLMDLRSTAQLRNMRQM